MKLRHLWILILLVATAPAAEDFLDRLRETLSVSSADGQIGARLSGTLDVESYHFQFPAPGLIYTPDTTLINPRLAVFCDTQLGRQFYLFAQVRVDRGFDSSDENVRTRLDEYALRYAPGSAGRLNLQIGKFATVVGNWVQRHGSWENPFITATLPYENLTGIWESVAVRSSGVLLAWAHLLLVPPNAKAEYADKHLRSPMIWGPSYASGLAIFGEFGRLTYAAEMKNAALASQPESWNFDHGLREHPTVSARLAYRPNLMWNFGLSASTGPYLRPAALPTIPAGFGLGDYREVVIGQDVSFAWHYWQVWLEAYRARFENPRIGHADTFAGYAEVKYKFTPQFSGAIRWNRQTYGDINHAGGRRPWGRDTWRLDVAPSYRLTPQLQLKLQYSYQEEPDAAQPTRQTFATQATLRF